MGVRLTNPSFSYSPSGTIFVSATVDILSADGVTIAYQTSVSANAHIQSNWKQELKNSIAQQIIQIKKEYDNSMALVKKTYPMATSPADALAQFIAEANAELVVL